MEHISLGFKTISLFSMICLLVGLYKPWIVLWWEDQQYRLKVIKVYGSIAIAALAIAWLIKII